MAGREDGDLALGEQFLGVEPRQVVERVVKDRDVGTAGPQQSFLFAGATQHHVDVDRSGFGGVGVQQLREQLAGRSGLGREDDAGVTGDGESCASGAMFGSFHSVQRCSSLVQQDRTGFGQGHRAAVTLQQGGTQTAFELTDRPRQWRLGHAQALRRAAEVQFLGHGDEVPQLSCLHVSSLARNGGGDTFRVSPMTQVVLDDSRAVTHSRRHE